MPRISKIVLLVTVALPLPAFADLPVIDPTSIAHLVTEIQTLQQSYQKLRQTYSMLTHINSLNGAISAFQSSGLENAMPDTSNVPEMFGGGYGPNGGYAGQYYDQNRVYIPQGNDWAAQQMRGDANRTAEIQGVATANLQAVQNREDVVLPRLQNEVANAKSITDLEAIQAQIGVERSYIDSQGVQAQNMQLAAYEQTQAERNAEEQQNRQSADQALTATCASISADGGSSGLCP